MPPTPSPLNPLRGIGLKMLSVMVFTLMAISIKASAPHVPPGQAVFFRSFFAIPVILVWLALSGRLAHGLATRNPLGHFWRGLVGTGAMALGFTALGMLPLPEATALGYAAPLLTVIFAAMFLGEEVRVFRLAAVAIGLVGVMIVLAPRVTVVPGAGTALETVGAFAALMGAVFAAMAQVFVRRLVQSEPTSAIVFYFSVTGAALSLLVTLPFGWVVPSAREAALLVGAGLLGGMGQILLTESYRHAEASVIAPFEYVSMIFALLLGYFVFAEVPTATMLVGAALIVLAGLFIIWRERRLGLDLARAPARARAGQGAQGDDAPGLTLRDIRPERDKIRIDPRARLRQCSAMLVFKVFRRPEWEAFAADGSTVGAPVDRADGYIHLSTASQLPETLRRHFEGQKDLVLVAVEVARGGPWLKWEPSRGGALFPHLYRDLEAADVVWTRPLADDPTHRDLPMDPTCA